MTGGQHGNDPPIPRRYYAIILNRRIRIPRWLHHHA